MTPVPKKRHTPARRNRRRNAATKRLKFPNLTKCPSCKKLKRSHVVCPHCGAYK